MKLLSNLNVFVLVQIGASILLFFIGDFGDAVTGTHRVKNCPPVLALIDSTVHAIIGFLGWVIIDPSCLMTSSRDLGLVTIGSSLIDIDHFLVARSLRIEALLHVAYRGPFHCSGLMLLLTLCLLLISPKHALILLMIFVPHHLRDSTRRGLYLYFPYVHTEPLPKLVVQSLLVAVPWLVFLLRSKYSILSSKSPTSESDDKQLLMEHEFRNDQNIV